MMKIKINRPGLQFRLIVVMSIWIAVLSYGLVSTFINDVWVQQWAANNALPLAATIFTLIFCSSFIIIGFRSKHVKHKQKTSQKIKKEKSNEIREI